MRPSLLLLSSVFLSFACSDSSTADQEGPSSGPPPTEGVEGAEEELVVSTSERSFDPEPIGVAIRSMGETRHGPLRVVVEETEDGQVGYMAYRDLSGDGKKGDEFAEGGTFAEDPSEDWVLYIHTTHEIYGYDGRSGLLKYVLLDVDLAEGVSETRSITETFTLSLIHISEPTRPY